MKKILTSVLVSSMMFLCIDAFAQFTVNAGYSNSSFKTKLDGKPIESQNYNLNGFFVEAEYNLGLFDNLSLVPGLRYKYGLSKKTTFDTLPFIGQYSLSTLFSEHYIDVPVNVKYTYPLLHNLKVFAFAGPTVSCGLASTSSIEAKVKVADKDLNKMIKEELDKLGNDSKRNNYGKDGIYSRFDVMLGLGLGVEVLDMIQIKTGYDFGLLNRISGTKEMSAHRNQFYIGVGYMF